MNAKQQQSNHFFRVKINGTLTCLSPLHIGAGLEIPLIKRDDGISREPVNKESSANNPPSAGKEPDYLSLIHI
ncbi:MAG: hypothetical protein KUG79_15990, partial [Pseudomonadales bacterium]|nr:hypothetical protein [Pseudomonadales bacterium]